MQKLEVDLRPVWILLVLLVVGGVATSLLFRRDAPASPAPAVGRSSEPPPATPVQAPASVEGEPEEQVAPAPFEVVEEVRGKFRYDPEVGSLEAVDPFGEVAAVLPLSAVLDQHVATTLDRERRVYKVDLRDGRRLEIPEADFEGLPSAERLRLYYPGRDEVRAD